MDQDALKAQAADLRAVLLRLENIAGFARKSGLSRKTLMRIRADEVTPTRGTMELIRAALKKHKPALKPEEPAGG